MPCMTNSSSLQTQAKLIDFSLGWIALLIESGQQKWFLSPNATPERKKQGKKEKKKKEQNKTHVIELFQQRAQYLCRMMMVIIVCLHMGGRSVTVTMTSVDEYLMLKQGVDCLMGYEMTGGPIRLDLWPGWNGHSQDQDLWWISSA